MSKEALHHIGFVIKIMTCNKSMLLIPPLRAKARSVKTNFMQCFFLCLKVNKCCNCCNVFAGSKCTIIYYYYQQLSTSLKFIRVKTN